MTQKKTKTKKKFEKKAPAEGGEVVKEEKKDIDEHPLANGHYLIVKYRDGSDRLISLNLNFRLIYMSYTVRFVNVVFLHWLDYWPPWENRRE